LEERHVAVGKGSGLGAPNGDAADHFALAQHWYADGAAAPERDAQGLEIFDVCLRVRYMNHGSLENDTAEDG
jgi:hypothetical protein